MFLSSTFALSFTVNGIYFKTYPVDTEVQVVRGPGVTYYSGAINIPASVQNTVLGTTTTYTVTSIGVNAFGNQNGYPDSFPTSVTLPNTISRIEDYAFIANTSLTTIVLPSSLEGLGSAFKGCTSLTSIVIPAKTNHIGATAFAGCSNLKTVTCLATTPPSIYPTTFDATVQNVYVPANSLAAYKSVVYPGWGGKLLPAKIQAIITAVEIPEESNYLIKTNDGSIEIANAYGKHIRAFDLTGRIIFETTKALNSERFTVNNPGVYIIKIDNFKKKVLIN